MILPFQPTEAEVAFAGEVKDYLKHGYYEAGKLDNQGRSAVGFLMATFGKLASSSREALKSALQRRVDVLRRTQSAIEDGNDEVPDENAAAAVGGATAKGKKGKQSLIRDEAKFVDRLLTRLEALPGPDSKLDGFASGLKKLVEYAPGVKVLIFTEYRATQDVLTSTLAGLFGKESVDTIHGSKKLDERKEVVRRFNEEDQPRFIVSTAAGGEGLNLQRRCHTIVSYDLPWNPNVLQQRIGRVYRYGQTKPVVVYNLKVDTDSDAYADNKVYEYLEKKLGDVVDALAKATDEGREDLLGDVLGQAAVEGLSLEELHEVAIKEGEERVKKTIDEKAKHLEEIMGKPEMTGMFKGLPLSTWTTTTRSNPGSRAITSSSSSSNTARTRGSATATRGESASLSSLRRSSPSWLPSGRRGTHSPLQGAYRPRKWGMRRSTRRSRRRARACSVLETPCSRRWCDTCNTAIFRPLRRSMCRRGTSDGRARGRGRGSCSSFRSRAPRASGHSCSGGSSRRSSSQSGGDVAKSKPELVEHVTEATQGPPRVDIAEARRAFEIGRQAANARLVVLRDEVRAEYPGDEAIAPVAVSELALAWVRAV